MSLERSTGASRKSAELAEDDRKLRAGLMPPAGMPKAGDDDALARRNRSSTESTPTRKAARAETVRPSD
jgi:hypothetical protein